MSVTLSSRMSYVMVRTVREICSTTVLWERAMMASWNWLSASKTSRIMGRFFEQAFRSASSGSERLAISSSLALRITVSMVPVSMISRRSSRSS